MFPALYKNEIYFRPFWNGVMLTSDDLPPPTKAILCSAIDQYCTAIDSYVENMVCINDTNVGTVVEPYAGGYVSARSNNGSAISETTAIIPTQSAIYQPLMLNVGETDGIDVGDIQAYLYEQEDYEALSDTAAAYPYSKGYALKYTRFSKDYTELSHRIKTSSSLADALTKPALANIIGAATNGRVGNTGVNLRTYLSQFIGIGDDDSDGVTHFAKLLFQPTYIPVVNARVRQYKPMFSEDDYQATIFYNQQSEVVDSEAFGEHVKGLVQKLGNHTEIRVYRFAKIDEVPTVGTLIDEKSVYNVAMTIYENHVDATICLVDHAELSTYIGVKNEIKTSDISTTKWCNRFINWEEFLVFTHEAHTGNALSITKEALADIVSFTVAEPLTCAMFTSYGENEDTIIEAFAPIKHLALGNSIYFQWEMLDNFAVGYTSEEAPDNATSAWSGTQYDRAQRAVRYCDSFGRMEKLDFQLIKTGPTVDNSLISVPHVTYDVNAGLCTVTLDVVMDVHVDCWILVETVHTDGSTTEYTVTHSFAPGESVYVLLLGANMVKDCGARVATATSEQKWTYTRALAHAYPKKHDNLVFNPIPSFRLYDLLVKKNSAEALKFAAQYHFRQDWREFVIGSGMSNFCSLVGGSCTQLQMFTSGLPINRFERHINFGDTYNYRILNELPTFTVDEENLRVIIRLPSSVNDYINATKSWGLVGTDRNGNRQLIFGENKNAKNEEFLRTIYLVPRQKNNEPQARATYTLTRTQSSSSVGCWVYIDEDLTGGIAYGSSMEIHRQASVKIWNSHSAGVNLTISKVKNHIDGTKEIISTEIFYIPYRGSYSFTMSSDMEFNVWTTHVSGGTSTPV